MEELEWMLQEKGILKYYRDPNSTRAGILLIRNTYTAKDQSAFYISIFDVPLINETLTLHAFVKRYTGKINTKSR